MRSTLSSESSAQELERFTGMVISQAQAATHEGNRPCGRWRCMTCTHIITGRRFGSTTTGEMFYTHVNATCKTVNVVYLIECSRCRTQYVGETENALHLRMNGHCSDYYRKSPDKPVVVHFNTQGHSFDDMKVMVIEIIGLALTTHRKRRGLLDPDPPNNGPGIDELRTGPPSA